MDVVSLITPSFNEPVRKSITANPVAWTYLPLSLVRRPTLPQKELEVIVLLVCAYLSACLMVKHQSLCLNNKTAMDLS